MNTTSASGLGVITAVSGGGASGTTKYFHPSFTGTASTSSGPSATTTFVTSVTGGTTTATTKYLSLKEE